MIQLTCYFFFFSEPRIVYQILASPVLVVTPASPLLTVEIFICLDILLQESDTLIRLSLGTLPNSVALISGLFLTNPLDITVQDDTGEYHCI